MKKNNSERLEIGIFYITALAFFIIGMFFLLSNPRWLGYFLESIIGRVIPLTKVIGVFGFAVAALIAFLAWQSKRSLDDDDRKYGGRR